MENITLNEFQNLDIRIGNVVKVEIPEWSHWVMKLIVNFGTEIGDRVIFAGIMHHYKPEDLEGKQFPFIINLESKKIGPKGDISCGMMLMAIGQLTKPLIVEKEKIYEDPVLLVPSKKIPNGTRIE